jgi:hypothetical protein
MKKILIITFCLLAVNKLTAQKKDTKIVLTPFTEKTAKFKSNYDSYDYFFTKNNFKKGDGKKISLVLFGKNRFEDIESVSNYDRLLFHKFYLFCFINGQNIKLESHWYDQDPNNNIEFENQNYTIKLKYDEAPYMFEKWQMLVINKADFKSTILNLYRYNEQWGE